MATQKEIGPSFYQELAAYGVANDIALVGQHFNWQPDGTLEFFSDTPTAVIAGVKAVYVAHDPATIPVAMQAGLAILAGLTVTSASAPAINGTYPIDRAAQTNISSVEIFIEKNGAFPGASGTSLAWYDIAGVAHIFPSVAIFSEFATAIANYVADLDLYAAGAPGSTLPTNSIPIG